jgi:hypothetical protein
MGHTVYVVLFKGIPGAAFYSEKDLDAYLGREGISVKEVREDMENNPMPNWEIYTVEVK